MASISNLTENWLLSVVTDLEEFAIRNSMPETANSLRSVYRTARHELRVAKIVSKINANGVVCLNTRQQKIENYGPDS